MNLKVILAKRDKLIKLTISLLILIFLFNFIDFKLFFDSIKNVNQLFLLALLFVPLNILLRAYRWKIILNHYIKIVSIKDSFVLNLVGIALNIFLPASFGDVAKSYYGYKWHGYKEEMLSSSILDKFLALFSVFIIGSLTSFLIGLYVYFTLSIILSVLMGITIFYPKIVPWSILNKITSYFIKQELNEKKLKFAFNVSNKIKIYSLSISLLAWLLLYLQFYLICLSFSIEISFIYILAVSPLMNIALLFPFTINGLGTGEAMVTYLFSIINISPTLAVLVSLVSQIVNAIIPGIFGFFFILRK